MNTAVTGAFSYSGKYITARLLSRGDQVITLTNHAGREHPFGDRVRSVPLDFTDPRALVDSLRGVDTFYNTYWVRFDRGANTQTRAVQNTHILVRAAAEAGVRRIVHISITNPSVESSLPYFQGKALNEKAVVESGMSYAILRPTVLFGAEDILINNIAWLLRRFPFFGIPGDGRYALQPVFVDDLAGLAVEYGIRSGNVVVDAVGPDIFRFRDLVDLIGASIGSRRPLVPFPPDLALGAARFISLFVRDVILTPEEIDGLMAGLLVSDQPALCKTRLADWLKANRDTIGARYASELKRHYV